MEFLTSEQAFARRYDVLSRQMAFRGETLSDFALWRNSLRSVLTRLIGLDRITGQSSAPVIEETVQLQGIRRDKILLLTEEGVVMPCYVLIPDAAKAGPLPVVVAPHGHGFGGMEAIAGNRDNPEIAKRIGEYNSDYGLQFAREGFIVFCPEARGFGRRRESTRQDDRDFLSSSCAQLNHMGIPFGITVTGMWVHDLQMLLDHIATRKDCDAGRIACTGLSGGGLQTLWLSALDDRIRCSVVSGYFYGVKDSLLVLSGNCSCNYVPGLWEQADMGDLGALIAPRPLLIETGNRDALNGSRGVVNVTEQMDIARTAYRLHGAEAALGHDVFEGGHRWHGAEAIPFVKKHLGL